MVDVPHLTKDLLSTFNSHQSDDLALAESQMKDLRAEYQEVDRQVQAYVDQLAHQPKALVEVVQDKVTKLAEQRHDLGRQVAALSDRLLVLRGANPDADDVKAALGNFAQLVRILPIKEQKVLLSRVCSSIEVGRPQSAAYIRAAKRGHPPRMYRVQLLLNTEAMKDLEICGDDVLLDTRPKANFETGFTINIPANGKGVQLIEGDDAVSLERHSAEEQRPPTALNVVARAIDWGKQLSADARTSAASLAVSLAVSPATLSLHLKVLKAVDPSIITYLKHCKDDHTLSWFSLRELLRLAAQPWEAQRDSFRQGREDAEKRRGLQPGGKN